MGTQEPLIVNHHLVHVSAKQDDEQSITFIQMIDGNPVESKIPKDIIVDIYAIVCNLHRY